MAIIKEINISNFRAFDELKIRDLSNINIFLGKNNSGKTSILESIFFIMGMSNPDLINKVSISRNGHFISSLEQVQYLFHKLDYKNIPTFFAEFSNGEKRNLKLSPVFKTSENFNIKNNSNVYDNAIAQNLQTNIDFNIQQLNFEFSLHEQGKIKKLFTNFIKAENNNQFVINMQNGYVEKYKTLFIRESSKNDQLTTVKYSEILKRNKLDEKSKILELIQKVEPNIINIQPLGNSLYFELRNIEPLLPISVIGDGIRHLLSVYTSILENQNSFVLIDEIENGLHFSVYPTLWKGLFSFAKNNNVQIFITTHNEEILRAIQKITVEGYNKKENIKLFTIANTEKNGYRVYPYEYDEFENAMKNGIELRK